MEAVSNFYSLDLLRAHGWSVLDHDYIYAKRRFKQNTGVKKKKDKTQPLSKKGSHFFLFLFFFYSLFFSPPFTGQSEYLFRFCEWWLEKTCTHSSKFTSIPSEIHLTPSDEDFLLRKHLPPQSSPLFSDPNRPSDTSLDDATSKRKKEKEKRDDDEKKKEKEWKEKEEKEEKKKKNLFEKDALKGAHPNGTQQHHTPNVKERKREEEKEKTMKKRKFWEKSDQKMMERSPSMFRPMEDAPHGVLFCFGIPGRTVKQICGGRRE